MFGQAKLTGCLALGEVVIGDAVLGHQAGGGGSDAGSRIGELAGPFMAGHGRSFKVESPPF